MIGDSHAARVAKEIGPKARHTAAFDMAELQALDIEKMPEAETKVLLWGTNPIRHGADTNDIVQILKDTSKQVNWVLPCVPHAEEEINEEVDVINTRLKRASNLITLKKPLTQNDLENDGYHANKQAIKDMATAVLTVAEIKEDEEEDTRTPPSDPTGKVNVSSMSVETTKAASILGQNRKTLKDIEEQCEVIITKEPGQGGHTIFTVQGNRTTNAARLLRKATKQGGDKKGTGDHPPKTSAQKRSTPENEDGQQVCMHFLNNKCKFGDKCRNTHLTKKEMPDCPHYLMGNCKKGNSCQFKHDNKKRK